jgi:heat shock protein HslJ
MKMVRRLACLSLVIVFVAAGCSAAAGPQLDGHDYLSVEVRDGGAAKQLVAGTRIHLRFDGTRLIASAGCNTMSGAFRIDGGRLVLDGGLATTEMGCDAERHAQDAWLAELLGSSPMVNLVASDLTIDGGSKVVRLLDSEVANPDRNLVGPTWTVESILTGDAVMSVPAGATATFVFKADGTLDLSPGCNRGGGTWKLQGAGIEISGVVLTKMACQGPGGELEGHVLAVLEAGTLTASIDADMLTLNGPGGGLQLRAG